MMWNEALLLLTIETVAVTIAPFCMFKYWLFFIKGRWYQGIFTDFMDLEDWILDDLKIAVFM